MAGKLSARAWRVVAALGFWALVAIAMLMRGTGGLLLADAALVWLVVFSLFAWRRQDEYVRAAQKFSWAFGGLFGLVASFILLPVFLQPSIIGPFAGWVDHLFPVDADPAVAPVLIGAVYIAVGQLIGFLVCWVGWHVAKR